MTLLRDDSMQQSFQQLILRLSEYWAGQGCVLQQPYDLEVGAGDYSLWEGRGFANMGGETFAFRAAFNYENRDDWYDSITGDYTGDPGTRDLLSLRLSFLWQPNEALSVLFKYSYSNLDFGGNVTSSYGDDPYNVPQNAPFAYKDKGDRFVLDVDYNFDSGIKFSSLTGYSTVDTINNLDVNGSIEDPIYWFLSQGKIDLFSQEFNLISPDDAPVRWVLGAFYQNQKAELAPVSQDGFVFVGGDPFGIGQLPLDYPWLGSPWTKDEDDWALFAHVAYDITEALELEAGLRYSDYSFYQITDYVFGFGDAPPELPFDGVEGPDRQDFSENSTDWKVGLNWTMDETNFIYGLISRGHTWGSVNIFPPWDPYSQMKVYNYEAGWKAAWSENRFLTQLSTYYETVTDYQAAFTDLDIPNSAGQVQNASTDSTIYGIELTAQANLDNLSMEFGISWNNSELGTFNNVVNPITLVTEDVTGAPFPLAPDFTANFGVSYTFAFANGSTLVPRVDYGYVADSYADLFVEPQLYLPSRSLLNLNVRWELGQWYASLWATNLTDERYIAAIQNNGSLYYAGPPRQWGVRVGYNF